MGLFANTFFFWGGISASTPRVHQLLAWDVQHLPASVATAQQEPRKATESLYWPPSGIGMGASRLSWKKFAGLCGRSRRKRCFFLPQTLNRPDKKRQHFFVDLDLNRQFRHGFLARESSLFFLCRSNCS